MWCRSCNIEVHDDRCPICGQDTAEDIPVEIYWCDVCHVPVINEISQIDKGICPKCGSATKYMAKDIRPVKRGTATVAKMPITTIIKITSSVAKPF